MCGYARMLLMACSSAPPTLGLNQSLDCQTIAKRKIENTDDVTVQFKGKSRASMNVQRPNRLSSVDDWLFGGTGVDAQSVDDQRLIAMAWRDLQEMRLFGLAIYRGMPVAYSA